MKKQNLTGKTYGRLTVIKEVPNKSHDTRWLCQCICGNLVEVDASNLKRKIKSCGCLRRQQAAAKAPAALTKAHEANTKHGQRRKHKTSLAYRSWNSMKNRCTNPKTPGYEHYGQRGITVCQSWQDSFEAFYADMGDRPLGTSLDRIDPNGNYEPGNCRWATPVEQRNNRRDT